MDLSTVALSSQRVFVRSFLAGDAHEAFRAATPSLTRFMAWDPALSLEAYADDWRGWLAMMSMGTDAHLVVRMNSTQEFLGIAGLHNVAAAEPEIGIWIKEARHGNGYGREAIAALILFVGCNLNRRAVLYPVAEQNRRSLRLAESLGGRIVGTRVLRKAGGVTHPMVIYRIPAGLTDVPQRK